MKGRYKPGESGNPKGRPRGATNKLGRSSKEILSEFLNTALAELPEIWAKLKPKEKAQLLRDFTSYELPKKQAVAVSGEIDVKGMTEEQTDLLAQKIFEYGKDHK